MSLSNANNQSSVVIPLGSPDADKLIHGVVCPKNMKITSVYLVNSAAIAADDSDYCKVELKNGANVVAELDSRAAHEDGIADGVAEALNLVDAYSEPEAGDLLSVNYDETDTGTAVALTDAVLVVNWHCK
jgi:hypothetical protein